MAGINGSQVLTQAGKSVLDRVQSAGPSDLSVSRTKIKELGNELSIGSVADKAEVTYNVESFDTSVEFEARLVGKNPNTFPSTPGSNEIDFKNAVPMDMLSLFKTTKTSSTIASGVISPYLSLSAVTYRFGVGDSATQTFTMNGDTELLVPGQPYYEEFTNIGVGPYTIAHAADLYADGVDSIRVLSVQLCSSTSGLYERVFYDSTGDAGYTNTTTTFTLPEDTSATYDTVKVTYSSQDKTPYTQTGNNPNGEKVHQTVSVVPAAVRSEHLDVYIGTYAATPTWSRMNSVQNVEANWSVTLENGEELGNKHYTYSEYDVPDVSGSIGIKAISTADLANKLSQITGVPSNQVIGPNSSVPIPIEMHVRHPDTGLRLKTIYIPDARFDLPGFNGQVDTRLENTLNWTSDSGQMLVYNGSRR